MRNCKNEDQNEAISIVKRWLGDDISLYKLESGLSNNNYIGEIDGAYYFIKIPCGNLNFFIDRKNIRVASEITMDLGISPSLIIYDENTGIGVWDWLVNYRLLNAKDLKNPIIFQKILKLLKKMHSAEIPNYFSKDTIFEKAFDVIKHVENLNFKIIQNHNKYVDSLYKIEESVAAIEVDWCLCHNDIMTQNFLYKDETMDLKLIDFDYASYSDSINDFAAFSTTDNFSDKMDRKFYNLYHNKWDLKKYYKMKLYKIVSDIKWSYWSLYQSVMSEINYDYLSWYKIKTERLERVLESRNYQNWLSALKK